MQRASCVTRVTVLFAHLLTASFDQPFYVAILDLTPPLIPTPTPHPIPNPNQPFYVVILDLTDDIGEEMADG